MRRSTSGAVLFFTVLAFSVPFAQVRGAAPSRRITTMTCVPATAPAPSLPGGDTVWIDDAVPSGASFQGGYGAPVAWSTDQAASGTQSLTAGGPATGHWESYLSNLDLPMEIGERVSGYLLINECAAPRQVRLTWDSTKGEQSAYWGENLIGGGIDMGPVPTGGQWVRFELPASVTLEQSHVTRIRFAHYDGQVSFDRLGKSGTACVAPAATQPAPGPAGETVWFDDSLPAGASLQNGYRGPIHWDSSQSASGTQSLVDGWSGAGEYESFVIGLNQRLEIGEKVFGHILVNPCAPPTQIRISWDTDKGTYHAIWGEQTPGWDTLNMGPIPTAGQWVRVEIPSVPTLEQANVWRIRLAHIGGQVWFDRFGKSGTACVAPAAPAAPAGAATDVLWVDDSVPAGATLQNGYRGPIHWDPSQHAGGTQALVDSWSGAGEYESFVSGLAEPLRFNEKVIAYLLVNPCAVPAQIRISWDTNKGTQHAIWGEQTPAGDTINMGPIPTPGEWIRVELPAIPVLEEATVWRIRLAHTGGQVWFDRLGRTGTACVMPAAPPAAPPAQNEVVWVDESVPAGASIQNGYRGPIHWDASQHASGSQALVNWWSGAGEYESFVSGLSEPIHVTEKVFAHILVNSCEPPTRIRISWDTDKGTQHAIWGEQTPSGDTINMGPIPAGGQWIRFELPSTPILDNSNLWRIRLAHVGGQVWFDRLGKTDSTCTPVVAPQPTPPAGGTVWLDELLPAGAYFQGGYGAAVSFNAAQAASGTHSLTAGGPAVGEWESFVSGLDFPMEIGERASGYLLINECSIPRQVRLTWDSTHGAESAYWGENLIGGGGFNMGPIPTPGQWVRFELPVSYTLEQSRVTRIRLMNYDGQVFYDRLGKSGTACVAPVAPQPTPPPPGDTVWVDDSLPAGAELQNGYRGPIHWDSSQSATGSQSLVDGWSGPGEYESFVIGLHQVLHFGEKAIAYIMVNPCAVPSQIRISWDTDKGTYHAIWGTQTPAGDTANMGPIPTPGQWIRVELPSTPILEQATLWRIRLAHTGGQVWFDRLGKTGVACIPAVAPQPVIPSSDTVWIDDAFPAGAGLTQGAGGSLHWDPSQSAAGTQSLVNNWSGNANNYEMHITGLSETLHTGESLVFYVRINECAPTQEIRFDLWGSGAANVYWGDPIVPGNATHIGPLPPAGSWQRLEVPVAQIGMAQQTLQRITVLHAGGQVWFDHIGVTAPDTDAPAVALTSPVDGGTVYNQPAAVLSGTVTDGASGVAGVTCNGAAATLGTGTFTCTVNLVTGSNAVTIVATDHAGNARTLNATLQYAIDHDPPTVVGSVNPPPNAAGWSRGATEVSFACSDAISGISGCTPPQTLESGANQHITGGGRDGAGNEATTTVTVNIDADGPLVTIDTPASPRAQSPLTVTGTVSDALSGVAGVTCNNVPATLTAQAFTCQVALAGELNLIDVRAVDIAGNETNMAVTVFLDDVAPQVSINQPVAGTLEGSSVQVVVYVADRSGIASATINGQTATLVNGYANATVTLTEGANQIVATATDTVGNTATSTVTVQRVTPTRVTIAAPIDFATLATATVTVTGTVSPSGTPVTVNGAPANVTGTTFTATNVALSQGRTVITAVATGANGTPSTANVNIYRDSIPPRLVVHTPHEGETIAGSSVDVTGMIDDLVVGTINGDQMTVTVNGAVAEVSNRAFLAQHVSLTAGANTLTVEATDQGGNTTTVSRHVTADLTAQARITVISGNDQDAFVGATLTSPLVVALTDANGLAVAGTPVTFRILENNGHLSDGTASSRTVTVTTNSSGRASVQWTLGMRAGAGNNRVEAVAEGFAGPARFVARANTGPSGLLVVDTGNNQYSAAGEPVARPMVAVVVDAGGNRIAGVPVTFSVFAGGGTLDGGTEQVVVTDSDGRAWARPALGPEEGNDNNVIEAKIDGVPGSVVFVASGRIAGAAAATRITGVVLDNSEVPIPGVTVRAEGTTMVTQTDAAGAFSLDAAPVGYVKLLIDGSTANRPGTWPMLEYAMYTVAGTNNTVGTPIYLLAIDVARGLSVSETQGGILTIPELPGFSLQVPAGSATFPGGSRVGTVSATLVHTDKMPMPPAFGQQPRFIVTVQPPGAHFDPPAPMTVPNLEGLGPGEITEFFSFDHDLGQFVSIGTGTVSEDGSVIRTDPGVGLIKGGWQSAGPPVPSGSATGVSVSLNVQEYAAVNKDIDVFASGAPAAGGVYFGWEIFDDPGDNTDNDPTVASWVSQPPCPSFPLCVARIKATKGGHVSLRVRFQSTGGTAVSQVKKIWFLQVTADSVTFDNSYVVYKDAIGVVSPPAILPPHWIPAVSTAAEVSKPVWLKAGQNIKVTLKLKIAPQLVSQMTDFVIKGVATGVRPSGSTDTFQFSQTVTLPQDSTFYDVLNLESTVALPAQTRLYKPFTIQWFNVRNGVDIPLGTSKNDMYVTLAGPTVGEESFLTEVYLAVATDGAATLDEAFANTWHQFSVNSARPANVTDWNGEPLYYYRQGFDTATGLGLTESKELLLFHNGQCRTFRSLFARALILNGVRTVFYKIDPISIIGRHHLIIKSWNFVAPNLDSYEMKFSTDPATVPAGRMFPPMPGQQYGDLSNSPGLPGQNTPTPQAKVFLDHVVLKRANGTVPIPGAPFYDPSYGVIYINEQDFLDKAVAAYGVEVLLTNSLSVVKATNVQFTIQPGP
jgi:hypothetical protein